MKVLLVEDDFLSSEWLAVFLRSKGLDVTTAFSVSEALAMVAKDRPDVVVTDIGMRSQDGFALLDSLKTNPRTENIPVVAASGYELEDEKKQRFSAFLSKPVEGKELLEILLALRPK